MEQKKATENLSQWFKLAEQTPWGPGVYEVESLLGGNVYSYWDGEKFKQISITKDDAYKERNHPTYRQQENIRWRGLASDPIAKPKPKARGNRRVTRYVCVYGVFNNPCAVFNTKKEAEKHVNSGKSWGYTKIRFRTPEAD